MANGITVKGVNGNVVTIEVALHQPVLSKSALERRQQGKSGGKYLVQSTHGTMKLEGVIVDGRTVEFSGNFMIPAE